MLKIFLSKLFKFSNSWVGTIVIVLLVIFFVAQAFVIPSGSMKRTLLIGDYLFVKKFSYGTPTPHIPWIEIPVLPDFNGNGHLIEGDKPQRGDIVVFRYPKAPKIHYVKRCIAVGGDEILFQEKHLYIHFHEGEKWMRDNYPKEKLFTLAGKTWVLNPYKEKFPGIQYDEDVNLFEQMQMYLAANDFAMQPVVVDELPKNVNAAFNAFYKRVPEGEFYMVGDNRDHSEDSRFWGSVPYSLIVGKPWFIYFSWDDEYKIRWNRIGRIISNLEYDERYLDGK
ncbi:signal peptidase I [Sulfurospirillum arcachonense]|uniref:signal peptidase I n=1 Tax=Sulfurospirillum arcachonense TaxID=57666 RepID=UPI0004B08A37|nr:signal peptidase I [Sulfurospirillum arcachonense]